MKILVTGTAGFIGSHLAETLVSKGHEVTGIDALTPYYSPEFKKHTLQKGEEAGVKTHTLDLASDDLSSVISGVEAVIHLAAQPGNTPGMSFEDYAKNNITATLRLIEACEKSDTLKQFVNIATSSIYGEFATCAETEVPAPISNYGVTKLAAEQLVLARQRDRGFPACSLRLYSVFGERERPDKLYPRLIKAIANDTEFPLFEGSDKHLRSFTYVGDIVQGFCDVLDHPEKTTGEIFNIGTDQQISTGEGIAIVEEIMGKEAKKNILPARAGDQKATHANIEKARSLLDYNPKTSAKEGLERMVNWYMNEIHGKVDYSE